MADEKTESTETVATVAAAAEPEVVRGPRGEVGEASISLTLKQKWHEATHNLVEVGDKTNPHRQAWVKKRGAVSLRRFAKDLAASGDKLAKEWFANKAGAKNQKRSEKNIKRIYEEKQASKAARQKKAAANKNKAKPAATEAAK
jgi:hypothetical protein